MGLFTWVLFGLTAGLLAKVTMPGIPDCVTSRPPHEAVIADRGKPRLFHRSAKWKKAKGGFSHGQLDPGGGTVTILLGIVGAVIGGLLGTAIGLGTAEQPGDCDRRRYGCAGNVLVRRTRSGSAIHWRTVAVRACVSTPSDAVQGLTTNVIRLESALAFFHGGM